MDLAYPPQKRLVRRAVRSANPDNKRAYTSSGATYRPAADPRATIRSGARTPIGILEAGANLRMGVWSRGYGAAKSRPLTVEIVANNGHYYSILITSSQDLLRIHIFRSKDTSLELRSSDFKVYRGIFGAKFKQGDRMAYGSTPYIGV